MSAQVGESATRHDNKINIRSIFYNYHIADKFWGNSGMHKARLPLLDKMIRIIYIVKRFKGEPLAQ